jgi:hypothetical protein
VVEIAGIFGLLLLSCIFRFFRWEISKSGETVVSLEAT